MQKRRTQTKTSDPSESSPKSERLPKRSAAAQPVMGVWRAEGELIKSNYNPVTRTFMKTVNLTIGERMKALELLNPNSSKFDLPTLKSVLDDVKNIAVLEDEEKEKTTKALQDGTDVRKMTPEEIKALPAGTQVFLKWDDAYLKEIQLDQLTVGALVAIIKQKSDAKELGLGDGTVVTLDKKLSD